MKTVSTVYECPSENLEALKELVERLGPEASLDDVLNFIKRNYQGVYESLSDYAQSILCHSEWVIPSHVASYIDYDRMAKDWELGGKIFTIKYAEGIHVFRSC
jgi:antirestriction protein